MSLKDTHGPASVRPSASFTMLKDLLLRNRWADQSRDFDLFYGKVKFRNLGFSIGKSENNQFFRNY